MEHITNHNIDQTVDTAVTLGNFDGIHLGHRQLISTTLSEAKEKGLSSVVFSFYPHPMFVFENREHKALIMGPDEKKLSIEEMGVDVYIEYPFDRAFAAMEPEEFAVELIFKKLRCKVLVVGENYKFGAKQKGDYKLLMKLGNDYGVKVIYVPSVMYENERVSSTRVRKALIDKDMSLANKLLTMPYFIYGEVVKGKQLGRTIGFPTINIIADPNKLFPPNGVYATKSLYNGKMYFGVTNVGINPTVNGSVKIVETYLFDFKKVVYGEYVKTYFFHFIRQEQKFPSVDDLQNQLAKDAQSAKDYFLTDEFKQWESNY
ncbi:MAG: bifunctional riboflavin kinase/FAD synthetase [Lachnospiraceae bacterium]|nr:bifunctional riboflavin kinase/FAD synthetase [Lachnospiraceae bacterium]